MAVAITQVERKTVFGDRRVVIADLAFSSTYATGGEALAASAFGLSRLDFLHVPAITAADGGTSGWVPKYDYTNAKLQQFQSTTGAPAALVEVANSTSYIASSKVRVMAVGV